MSSSALPNVNETKWHDLYPELGTGPIPIEPYVSREYFEKERALIFRKVWLQVGRVEQIPGPGDYFVKELAICNTSILVVRGKDDVVVLGGPTASIRCLWRSSNRRSTNGPLQSPPEQEIAPIRATNSCPPRPSLRFRKSDLALLRPPRRITQRLEDVIALQIRIIG